MRSSGFVCQACNPPKRQKQQKLRGLATMEIFTVFKKDFFPILNKFLTLSLHNYDVHTLLLSPKY